MKCIKLVNMSGFGEKALNNKYKLVQTIFVQSRIKSSKKNYIEDCSLKVFSNTALFFLRLKWIVVPQHKLNCRNQIVVRHSKLHNSFLMTDQGDQNGFYLPTFLNRLPDAICLSCGKFNWNHRWRDFAVSKDTFSAPNCTINLQHGHLHLRTTDYNSSLLTPGERRTWLFHCFYLLKIKDFLFWLT